MLFLLDAPAILSDALAPVDPRASPDAVAWFRARAPVRPETWRALSEGARRRAFTVSGATGLDIVTQVWRAIDSAVASGTDFTEFKRQIGDSLRDAWAGTSPSRLAVIFRNNVQSAYAAGRYAQSTDPDVLRDRPYWRFDAILDSRTSLICQPLDGITRPATDGFWRSYYPPLHHQCRSGVTTLSEEQATGESRDIPANARPPQTGWGGAPDLAEWTPNAADYPPELWSAFERWRNGQ